MLGCWMDRRIRPSFDRIATALCEIMEALTFR